MKLVPIEPTGEMIKTGIDQFTGGKTFTKYAKDQYKAMTAECPTVEVVDFGKDPKIKNLMHVECYEDLINNGYKIIKEI